MTETLTGPLITLEHICKSYNIGQSNEAEVLHDVSIAVAHGEFVALIGPSGSGKSTLLNIIGLLEKTTTGTYQVAGQEVSHLNDAQLTQQRRVNLGFVFQFHHLLPAFTALENVTLPALMREGMVSAKELANAKEVLSGVGLASAMGKKPGELSGGMQQRVAIARALVLKPPLVLADEPTGNLDRAASDEVFALLRKMHADLKISFLIVTHDPALAARCDRIIELVDGRVQKDEAVTRPETKKIQAEINN
jgi:lipoprotein-releasing system ATP-binding protein